jgi:hypothetical protein
MILCAALFQFDGSRCNDHNRFGRQSSYNRKELLWVTKGGRKADPSDLTGLAEFVSPTAQRKRDLCTGGFDIRVNLIEQNQNWLNRLILPIQA